MGEVQAVQNWADIRGRIVSIAPHHELSEYLTAQIDVSDVALVPGFANMFEWAKGRQIEVNIPAARGRELSLAVGDSIACRVRKSGPTSSFVDPGSLKRQ